MHGTRDSETNRGGGVTAGRVSSVPDGFVASVAAAAQPAKDLVPRGEQPRGRVKRVRSGNNFLTYLRLHLLRATNCETSRNSSLPIAL